MSTNAKNVDQPLGYPGLLGSFPWHDARRREGLPGVACQIPNAGRTHCFTRTPAS